MMMISTADRIAALAVACQTERDAVERAGFANNGAAVAINLARLVIAEGRLVKATCHCRRCAHPSERESFQLSPGGSWRSSRGKTCQP